MSIMQAPSNRCKIQSADEVDYQTATSGFNKKDNEKAIKRLFDPCKVLTDYHVESKRLTEEAISICFQIGLNPEDLYEKYPLYISLVQTSILFPIEC